MQKPWKMSIFTLWLIVFIGNVLSLPDDIIEEVNEVKDPIDDLLPDGPVETIIDEPVGSDATEVIEQLDPEKHGNPLFHSVAGIIHSVGKTLSKGGGVF